MCEKEIEELLVEEFDLCKLCVDVSTFKEASLCTPHRGVVVCMEDGSEFQVTIVRSRFAKNLKEED